MTHPDTPAHDGIVEAVHAGPDTNPSAHPDTPALAYHWSTDAAREEFLRDRYSGDDIPL